MLRIQRMPGLPENIGEFVAEVADELEVLYGADAADHYRRVAIPTLSATIEHPLVDVLGACDGARTVGMLFGFVRDAAARITFLHVLRDHAGLGVEGRLVRESVRTFQAGGVDAIVAECVAFGATRLGGAFDGLDFSVVPRQIMMADVRFPALAFSGPAAGRALTSEDYGDAAAVVADAYVGHADRRVHLDARDEAAARTFVETAAGGSYGPVFPGFLRGIWAGSVCAGVILASEPMPGIGFVLQVAVRRAFQGQSLGTQLMREAADAFRRQGLDRTALGVTVDNPARRLYERLGFAPIKPIDAYAWWRPGIYEREAS